MFGNIRYKSIIVVILVAASLGMSSAFQSGNSVKIQPCKTPDDCFFSCEQYCSSMREISPATSGDTGQNMTVKIGFISNKTESVLGSNVNISTLDAQVYRGPPSAIKATITKLINSSDIID